MLPDAVMMVGGGEGGGGRVAATAGGDWTKKLYFFSWQAWLPAALFYEKIM